MPHPTHLGGVTTRRALVVGRSRELPDLVLKYEVLERIGDQYLLGRTGHDGAVFNGYVGDFELLGTSIFRERERFVKEGGHPSSAAWELERERLMIVWDAFPPAD